MPRLNPVPTLEAIQDKVGEVSTALFAVRDLSKDLGDYDHPAFRLGVLCGILGEHADEVYGMLSEYINSTTTAEETRDGNATGSL